MNQQEQARIQVLNNVLQHRLPIVQAAEIMGVSERHTKRLLAAYRKHGASALAHGNRGRRPHNAVPEATAATVVKLASNGYAVSNQAKPGPVKIGMTDRDDVRRRMSGLYTTGPQPFERVAARQMENQDGRESKAPSNRLRPQQGQRIQEVPPIRPRTGTGVPFKNSVNPIGEFSFEDTNENHPCAGGRSNSCSGVDLPFGLACTHGDRVKSHTLRGRAARQEAEVIAVMEREQDVFRATFDQRGRDISLGLMVLHQMSRERAECLAQMYMDGADQLARQYVEQYVENTGPKPSDVESHRYTIRVFSWNEAAPAGQTPEGEFTILEWER